MAEIFPRHALSFEVLYMAWTVPGRYWVFENKDFGYPYRVFDGPRPRLLEMDLYTNPGLLGHLWRSRPDVMIVGGYNSPTHALSPYFSRRSLRFLESESNIDSPRWKEGPVRWLKRALIRHFDGYIGPGVRSLELLQSIDPSVSSKPFIEFPNLVDERVFRDGVAQQRLQRDAIRRELGVADDVQLWFCPARLEDFKGLHLFLPWLEDVKGISLLIAGEGSLRPRLQAMIDNWDLPVRLIGQKNEAEMVRLYAAADLFVLPSLRDPSPLSPVEACASRLPVLASRRIGNLDHVIVEGQNGWSFDPETDGRELVRRVASLSLAELRKAGEISARLFAEHFDADRCITLVAEGIRAAHAQKRRSRS
jgi:glycosyltransferase involved in cell wall biosynthesis